MNPPSPYLTVVIPAYNEEARLGPTLESVVAYLGKRPFSWEIVVVDDGSRDGTFEAAETFARRVDGVRVLKNPGNRGKGYSVRQGMLEGAGRYLLFSDADLSTPIEEAEKMLRAHRRGADVAVASRRLARSVLEIKQPWYRELMGRTFNWAVQALAVRGISDTQCGFKSFSREAAKAIFQRARIERFGFDVELLFLARKYGFTVRDVPVRWIDSPESRVNPFRDPYRMLLDVVRVRLHDISGDYRRIPGS